MYSAYVDVHAEINFYCYENSQDCVPTETLKNFCSFFWNSLRTISWKQWPFKSKNKLLQFLIWTSVIFFASAVSEVLLIQYRRCLRHGWFLRNFHSFISDDSNTTTTVLAVSQIPLIRHSTRVVSETSLMLCYCTSNSCGVIADADLAVSETPLILTDCIYYISDVSDTTDAKSAAF
jgi:hypothetical protein